jgi:cyclin-dependent kinase 12/13
MELLLGTRSVDAYEKIDLVGEGTYGRVWKAKCRESNVDVALKKFRMKNEKDGFPITAIREIRILKELDHKNIIKVKEIVTGKPDEENEDIGSFYLVFEFMDHDMAGLLESGVAINEDHIKCYFKQLLEGLHYLHSNNILHRDIKTSNLLINNKGILKLGDFGLARPISESDPGKYTNKVITLWYRPPELLLGAEEYGTAVDMWSAGCILGELLSPEKRVIFPGNTEADQLDKIFKLIGTPTDEIWPDAKLLPWYKSFKPTKQYKSRLREKYKHVGENALELLDNLLSLDPKKRYSASDALESKYFKAETRICDPSQLPSYPSSHEYTVKKRKQKGLDAPKNPKRGKLNHNNDDNTYSQQGRGGNFQINNPNNGYSQNQRKQSISRIQNHDTTQTSNRTARASLENQTTNQQQLSQSQPTTNTNQNVQRTASNRQPNQTQGTNTNAQPSKSRIQSTATNNPNPNTGTSATRTNPTNTNTNTSQIKGVKRSGQWP